MPLTSQIQHAVERFMAVGEEVSALLAAVRVVVVRIEDRLQSFLVAGEAQGVVGLRSLVVDVGHLYSMAVDLARLASGMTAPARADLVPVLEDMAPHRCSEPAVDALWTAAELTLSMFDNAERTVQHLARQAQRHVEVLREMTRRFDAPPDVVAVVDTLLARYRVRPAEDRSNRP